MKHGSTRKPDASMQRVNSVQTSNRYLIVRESGEPSKMGKQKMAFSASAPIDDARKWNSINWKFAQRRVRRLQVRIAKAVKENRWNKVKTLQYMLTRSFYAKLLAVKRVTSNKGKKTPGVDGILWQGTRAKWRAVSSLRRRGYRPQPLKRTHIPKKNGKKRPLSIPTMKDRAMQALYKLALSPIAESTADRNSYGFREGRSCADAVHSAVPRRSRVNFIRYADDFIITGKSKRLLEDEVKPTVEAFLAERGLSLSPEKTVIAYIKSGFTFLGQTFRKHGRVLHITPSTEGVLALVRKVGTIIRTHVSVPIPALIKKLNATLRGWAHYHRHVVASEAFSRIDNYVFEQLWRMLRQRHRNKSKKWLFDKYWTASGRKHVFAVKVSSSKGLEKIYQVGRICSIGIKRHIKIKADANPYLPEYAKYYWQRRQKGSKLLAALSARQRRAMTA